MSQKATQRFHSFEFNDSAFVPAFIRESLVDILGATMRKTNYYVPVASHFLSFCKAANVSSILDVCSGTGEAACQVISEARKELGLDAELTLSDINPRPQEFLELELHKRANTSYQEWPLDVLNLKNSRQDAITIFAGFHHFKPDQATQIFNQLTSEKKSIFIVEPLKKNLGSTLPLLKHSFIPGMFYALKTNRNKFPKLLFCNVIPIVPFLGWWDTFISAKRSYSEKELSLLVEPHAEYTWSYREVQGALGQTLTIFSGIPKT